MFVKGSTRGLPRRLGTETHSNLSMPMRNVLWHTGELFSTRIRLLRLAVTIP